MDPVLAALGIWVLFWSLAALVAAGLDKRRAQERGPRTRERTLLALALVGGSPGLVVGMAAFRHKTRKRGFQLRLAAILALQLAAFSYAVWVRWLPIPLFP